MAEVALNLVVIRSANVERAVKFYGALGLSFVKEQHGQGPEHYAAQVGPTVIEIYPENREFPTPAPRHLGFRVPSLDNSLAALQEQGVEVHPPKNTPWGRRALVKDPDGNRVDLSDC